MKPKELKERTKGIVHLVMTHFDDYDELDLSALKKSVRHVVNVLKGEDAVFLITGSTAEFYAMTDEENGKVIRTVVEEVNNELPVIAGTGRAGTTWTIKMSQHAQKLGADGVMLVNPYYHLVTPDGLYRHHKEVAENIDIGVMIYNNPVTSKLWITPELMAKLSKVKNIVLDKENTANVVQYYWMQKTIDPEDMVIICGLGQLYYAFESLFGCPAYVTELANFAPDLAIGLYKAAKGRDIDKLIVLYDKIALYHQFISTCAHRRGILPTVLSPQVAIQELPLYQSVCKAAMESVGLPGGKVRSPMDTITSDEKKDLNKILKKMEVL